MKKYIIRNIKNIPLEGTHNLPGSRKTLVSKEDINSDNMDAFTKGLLKKDMLWDWHLHREHDEICVVLKGSGEFYWEDEFESYKTEDVIIIPSGGRHKIKASEDSEFYFVRIAI